MTIMAQHGYGKKDRIDRGISDGSIQGVIMSPRDELPHNLASFLSALRVINPRFERLVDPQFHVGATSSTRVGNLSKYPHYRSGLTPTSFSSTNIQNFVRNTLQLQNQMDVTAIVSPTVVVDELSSQWAQIAMMLAQETLHQHDGSQPLLISLVVREDVLRQKMSVDGWLDNLTQMDVDGFYLIVLRASETYGQRYDPDVLASLMRVCYSLAEINRYRVIVGYSDMVTLLLHAVGVTATASGWGLGLRQFTLQRFQERDGGRPARSRYSSLPLLNSIYVTELGGLYNSGIINSALSDTPYDARFIGGRNPENVAWTPDDSSLHHWYVLNALSHSLVGTTIEERLNSARDTIAQAATAYSLIGGQVPFSTQTGQIHLTEWLNAVEIFRSNL